MTQIPYMSGKISKKNKEYHLVDIPFATKKEADNESERIKTIHSSVYKEKDIIVIKDKKSEYWGVYALIIDHEKNRKKEKL